MKKYQTTLSDEIECKIIRLFALGMSYQNISREIEELYAFSVSTATISAVTDKVILYKDITSFYYFELTSIK